MEVEALLGDLLDYPLGSDDERLPSLYYLFLHAKMAYDRTAAPR
jgi:hypothetical protein